MQLPYLMQIHLLLRFCGKQLYNLRKNLRRSEACPYLLNFCVKPHVTGVMPRQIGAVLSRAHIFGDVPSCLPALTPCGLASRREKTTVTHSSEVAPWIGAKGFSRCEAPQGRVHSLLYLSSSATFATATKDEVTSDVPRTDKHDSETSGVVCSLRRGS